MVHSTSEVVFSQNATVGGISVLGKLHTFEVLVHLFSALTKVVKRKQTSLRGGRCPAAKVPTRSTRSHDV